MSKIGEPLTETTRDAGFDKFLNRPFEGLGEANLQFQEQTGYSYNDLVSLMESQKAKSFTTTIAFTSATYRSCTWAEGVVDFQDGKTTPTIASGTTGNIASRTYVYYDPNDQASLQTTTTSANATKGERVLLAIVVPNANTNGMALVEAFSSTGTYISNLSVEHLTAGTIRSKSVTLAVAAGTGDCYFNAGKCFGKGTKILMCDGSTKNVEDIVVGDSIMGDDSTPRKILALGRGQEEMFKVTLKNGDYFTCNKSHILSLKKNYFYRYRREMRVLTKNISVKDYLKASWSLKHCYKAYKNPVEYQHREVPIDPYFLGLWLGDGTSKSVAVTSADKEIIDFLQEYAFKLGMKCRLDDLPNNKAKYVRITTGYQGNMYKDSLQKELRKLGVLGNKHIPTEYFVNDRKTRMKLLAGLLDSDGNVNNNNYEFCQKRESLINDVKKLALSLGFFVGKKRFRVIKGIKYFRIHISNADFSELPIRVKRKITVKKGRTRKYSLYPFKVKSLGVGDYYGFNIDGNKLFLLEDCTVCHNTDFTNTQTGFILGIDDSDSDKAKLYIGDSTTYLNWTGSALNIAGSVNIVLGSFGGTTTVKFDGTGTDKGLYVNDGTNDVIFLGIEVT